MFVVYIYIFFFFLHKLRCTLLNTDPVTSLYILFFWQHWAHWCNVVYYIVTLLKSVFAVLFVILEFLLNDIWFVTPQVVEPKFHFQFLLSDLSLTFRRTYLLPKKLSILLICSTFIFLHFQFFRKNYNLPCVSCLRFRIPCVCLVQLFYILRRYFSCWINIPLITVVAFYNIYKLALLFTLCSNILH